MFIKYYEHNRVALPAGLRPQTLLPVHRRIFADDLTPVLAYRRLAQDGVHTATPSFLFESVVGGDQVGRFSYIGTSPSLQIVAYENDVEVTDENYHVQYRLRAPDPWVLMRQLTEQIQLSEKGPVPDAFCGGWVGFGGYDTLPFSAAPKDDRHLPDLQFALYREVIVFDNITKTVYVVVWVPVEEHGSVDAARFFGAARTQALVKALTCSERDHILMPSAEVLLDTIQRPQPMKSNMTKEQFFHALERISEYIYLGDTFQTVFSQRFERETSVEPFLVYRALRIVNPSPYMIYMRAKGCILISSSPEILCKTRGRKVWNRPLAGTRARGLTPEDDERLERELLVDEKDRAEHVMLVDLGRNDVGRVAEIGSVQVEKLFEIERYSHVMHISSTITGKIRPELSCWDALRATLPAGTISGAPKIRSMQIIDELEPTKRGPYGGGIGYVSFDGNEMDVALALRTMVIPDASTGPQGPWQIHIQAGAGIVLDSDPESEYMETINKAAALGRAVDLAEQAFLQTRAQEAVEEHETTSRT
ncbi:anthranilate synthase component [Cyanidiococcus yangmingshanensis]|uniref:Anthranilate synthase component n=1 Tax=Cyanidiococcus yangmingshanensis TaxID=2690220 RepID=A0A7J7IK64_9RHOD|nr:anthranilate synthase component [Cyanidiococcus yangmingshanensis]